MSVQIGVGLRPTHYSHLENESKTPVEWFEIISENYMDSKGRPLEMLDKFRKDFPFALHGVGMSIGSADGLNMNYMAKLKSLVDRVEPIVVSDHLCWTGLSGQPTHDLLPLPYTKEAVEKVSDNIDKAQNILGRSMAIENVSTYLSYKHSEMTEWEFIAEIQKRTGCQLLLDVNNVFVNSQNHDFNAKDFIDGLPLDQVAQIHLAGHTDMGEFLFDTHSAPVCDDVWSLLQYTKEKIDRKIPLLVEWDDDIPSWQTLEAEAVKAAEVWNQGLQQEVTQ